MAPSAQASKADAKRGVTDGGVTDSSSEEEPLLRKRARKEQLAGEASGKADSRGGKGGRGKVKAEAGTTGGGTPLSSQARHVVTAA